MIGKVPIATLSTTEVEFVVATSFACQAIWLRKILDGFHFKNEAQLQFTMTVVLQSNS